MQRGFRSAFYGAWLLAVTALATPVLLGGCTGRAEAVRAAQPYLESFTELRVRATKLLALRIDTTDKRLLLAAMNGDEESLPERLKPRLRRMRESGSVLQAAKLDQDEATFWRLFDYAFAENPNVLEGELLYVEEDGSTSLLRYPRESEIPAGVTWYGLRENRTFVGLASCATEAGSEPCVLLQRRHRPYPRSAGLTVAYKRTPVEVSERSD
jgi:hypothetical protein